jgi:hypothetical protein
MLLLLLLHSHGRHDAAALKSAPEKSRSNSIPYRWHAARTTSTCCCGFLLTNTAFRTTGKQRNPTAAP